MVGLMFIDVLTGCVNWVCYLSGGDGCGQGCTAAEACRQREGQGLGQGAVVATTRGGYRGGGGSGDGCNKGELG